MPRLTEAGKKVMFEEYSEMHWWMPQQGGDLEAPELLSPLPMTRFPVTGKLHKNQEQ
jgi:hypothetical protein